MLESMDNRINLKKDGRQDTEIGKDKRAQGVLYETKTLFQGKEIKQ
jgi:hypothetical protein